MWIRWHTARSLTGPIWSKYDYLQRNPENLTFDAIPKVEPGNCSRWYWTYLLYGTSTVHTSFIMSCRKCTNTANLNLGITNNIWFWYICCCRIKSENIFPRHQHSKGVGSFNKLKLYLFHLNTLVLYSWSPAWLLFAGWEVICTFPGSICDISRAYLQQLDCILICVSA